MPAKAPESYKEFAEQAWQMPVGIQMMNDGTYYTVLTMSELVGDTCRWGVLVTATYPGDAEMKHSYQNAADLRKGLTDAFANVSAPQDRIKAMSDAVMYLLEETA